MRPFSIVALFLLGFNSAAASDATLLESIAMVESGMNRKAIGAAGERGMYQVGRDAWKDAEERLKAEGFWVYGADAAGGPAWDKVFNTPLVLIIGSEGFGMRPLVRGLCDELVGIPQASGGVESLNASAAAAVLLYEIARQNTRNI